MLAAALQPIAGAYDAAHVAMAVRRWMLAWVDTKYRDAEGVTKKGWITMWLFEQN